MHLSETSVVVWTVPQQEKYPTQIRFAIAGERVKCLWSNLTSSFGRTKLPNSLRKQKLNFPLARDQVVLLETTSNLCASRRGQANDFSQFCFSIFEL